jgi:hypothetical protein
LKDTDKQQFQQLLRTKLPKDETQSVKEDWDRFKTGFTEAAEEVCGQKMERKGTRKNPCGQTIKEEARRKNVWREWLKERTKEGK